MRSRVFRPTGFTLIELMVTTGIIAVLLSVLFPAMSKARQAASAVQCASNMRQIALALTLYASRHGGTYPGPGQSWYTTDYDWLFWQDAPSLFARDINQSRLQPFLGLTGERLKSILRCPMDDVDNEEWHPVYGDGPYRYSYSMTWKIYDTQIKAHSVQGPSEKILLVEEDRPNDGMWVAYAPEDLLGKRHGGLGNCAFFDGHVERLSQAEANFDPHRTDPFL